MQGSFDRQIDELKKRFIYLLAHDEPGFLLTLKKLLSPLEGVPYIETRGKEAVFVGDLHGDLQSLLSAVEVWRSLGSGDWLLVFLGDYADRGSQGLEVLLGVLLLKALYPHRVLLLRGNHEDPNVNRHYGFLNELELKLGPQAVSLFETLVIPAYTRMPVVARLELEEHRVLAVHGGPSPGLTTEEAAKLPIEVSPRAAVLLNLLWSDPRENVNYVEPSFRGAGNLYGERLVDEALKAFNVNLIVRGHEAVEGVKISFGGKLYTVFTCRHYGVTPAVLLVDRGIKEVKFQ